MIEAFLSYLKAERGLSPLTVSAYAADLRQWEQFMRSDHPHGDFSPLDYTTADLRLWLASMSGCSATTVRRKAATLRAFYRFLMVSRGLKNNPASLLSAPRAPRALPVFIRPDEMKSLLDDKMAESNASGASFDTVRNSLILLMLYATGIRSSELTGLLDANVDCRKCELKVHGKRNKDRIVPFGRELADAIEHYRKVRDTEAGSTEEFFVKSDGKPLSRRALYAIVHSELEGRVRAGRLSPHVLRHSFATDMLNAGAQLQAVSNLMGHSSLAATQVYTHITYRDLKQNYLTAHPRAKKKGENYGSKN